MSKVYFSKEISSENIVKMYKILNKELEGNVCIKVHSGEEGNTNYLKPLFLKEIVDYVKGTIVECNTAYPGARNETEKHKQLMDSHEWSKYFNVDIMDSEGSVSFEVDNGKILKENMVGKHILNYDSSLVISHFKGHPMGGFGGALKQLSIGFASSEGKSLIHSGGRCNDQYKLWDIVDASDTGDVQTKFIESMADAASSVVKYFEDNIIFINIMCNMSVDCDCFPNPEKPCLKDMGILCSLDPVAIDKACIDIVKKSNDPGKEHFLKRIESRNGEYILDCASKLGIGSKEYELIEVTNEQ